MRAAVFVSIIAGCLVFGAGNCHAAGSTAGEILKMPVGARPAALGEAFASVAGDINALYYNPAGVAGIEGAVMSVSYNKGLTDANNGALTYGREVADGKWALAAGVVYLDGGGIELNYADKPSVVKKAQQDVLLTASAGRRGFYFFDAAGVSLKFWRSVLVEEAAATAVAADAGVSKGVRLFGQKFNAGFSAQNIGPQLSYVGGLAGGGGEWLPWTVRAGVSSDFKIGAVCGFSPAVDINYYIFDKKLFVTAGLEYSYGREFFARAGYSGKYWSSSGFSAGVGFRKDRYQIDYAAAFMGSLGISHYLTLGMRL